MPVIKEWLCSICGPFESASKICPACGTGDTRRIFLTPPGIKTALSKQTDRNLKQLVEQAGLSDFSNNLSTKHEKKSPLVWANLRDTQILNDMKKIVPGGVDLSRESVRKLPGKYDAIYHADDKKASAR